jgi:hypothetical protein
MLLQGFYRERLPAFPDWQGLPGMIGLALQPSPIRALNSAVECHLHTVEVAGSNPAAPTIESITYIIFRFETGVH